MLSSLFPSPPLRPCRRTPLALVQAWLHDSFNVFTVSGLLVIMVGLRLYHSVPEPEDPRDSFDPPSPPTGKRYG